MSKQGVKSARTSESGSIYTGETEQNNLDLKTTPLKTWCFSSGKAELSGYDQENDVELREYHLGQKRFCPLRVARKCFRSLVVHWENSALPRTSTF